MHEPDRAGVRPLVWEQPTGPLTVVAPATLSSPRTTVHRTALRHLQPFPYIPARSLSRAERHLAAWRAAWDRIAPMAAAALVIVFALIVWLELAR